MHNTWMDQEQRIPVTVYFVNGTSDTHGVSVEFLSDETAWLDEAKKRGDIIDYLVHTC